MKYATSDTTHFIVIDYFPQDTTIFQKRRGSMFASRTYCTGILKNSGDSGDLLISEIPIPKRRVVRTGKFKVHGS